MTKQELILSFALLLFVVFVSLGLALDVFGEIYEDGSFVIQGCLPFQLCQ